MSKILTTCYVEPDMDGYASSFAYAEYLNKTGKDAKAAIFGRPHFEVEFVLNKFRITPLLTNQPVDQSADIVCTDASDLHAISKEFNPLKVIEIIDHREFNGSKDFPNAKLQIDKVGSAATLITERYRDNNVEISNDSAALLYSAILSNTINFQAKTTTDRDRSAAKWLNGKLALPESYVWEMFAAKSDLSGDKLYQIMEIDLATFQFGSKKVGIVQLEIINSDKIITDRLGEIFTGMIQLKNERSFDHIFATVSDLKDRLNVYISDDEVVKSAISKALNIEFTNNVARKVGVLMRKELVPLIKDYFSEE